ncbi:MAG: hypothetical protein KAR33_11530 [Candidatus Thorarchaeota archaeon]|nr:hypothetical protein [Candidatus Thorarchaeota archaeon]
MRIGKKKEEEGNKALTSLFAVERNAKVVKHYWAAVRLLCNDYWPCVPEGILEVVVWTNEEDRSLSLFWVLGIFHFSQENNYRT